MYGEYNTCVYKVQQANFNFKKSCNDQILIAGNTIKVSVAEVLENI